MSKEFDQAMADFLAKGGVIQQGAYRESGRVEGADRTSPWGVKKAGRPPADAVVEIDEDEE
jgi:hypothetical protein